MTRSKLSANLSKTCPNTSFSEPCYSRTTYLINRTLSNTKQALNDFNIAINLDNNYSPVYLERAKLYFLTENYTKALEDLNKFAELTPDSDVEFHKTALYLVNGLYPMA